MSAALAAVGCFFLGQSTRHLMRAPDSTILAKRVVRILTASAAHATDFIVGSTASAPLPLYSLLQNILDTESSVAVDNISDAQLRERIRTNICEDYRQGAVTVQQGWVLSKTEVALFQLLSMTELHA